MRANPIEDGDGAGVLINSCIDSWWRSLDKGWRHFSFVIRLHAASPVGLGQWFQLPTPNPPPFPRPAGREKGASCGRVCCARVQTWPPRVCRCARKARTRLLSFRRRPESIPDSDSALAPPPVGLRRGAQPKTDQGERLFEPKASSSSTPFSASTGGCPGAQRRGPRPSGRLLFAYFLLAKQEKVSRPPGRDPASRQTPVRVIEQRSRRKSWRGQGHPG